MVLLLSPLVIGIIILLLGLAAFLIIRALLRAGSGGVTTGGGSSGPAIHKLEFTSPTPDPSGADTTFDINTEETFTVLLSKWNAGQMRYDGMDDEDSFVGIVEPASVNIEKINSQPAGSVVSIPGTQAQGYKAKSASDGTIKIVLKGPDAADGTLTVYYASSAAGLLTATADFSIQEP